MTICHATEDKSDTIPKMLSLIFPMCLFVGCASKSTDTASIEAACTTAGVLFIRYPVTAMDFPGPDLQGLGALFDDPAHRVLAYCRTGTRCANLWIASRSEDALADAVTVSREIGFDLSMALR